MKSKAVGTTHKVINEVDARRRELPLEARDLAKLARGDDQIQSNDVLAELTTLELTVYVLRSLDQARVRRVTITEIAAVVHLSPRSVERLAERARKKLEG